MANTPFSEKLELVLKVFSMSRAQLAAAMEVDKSLVGRWVSGAVMPSAHNLSKLTAFVSARQSGFMMLDWERDMADFAVLMGARLPGQEAVLPFGLIDGLPLPIMDQIRAATAVRAADLQCFFRTTRPSHVLPGRFLHDHGMVRLGASGLLEVRMGVRETAYHGWLMPVGGQFFCVATDGASGALILAVFSGVPAGRVQRMDGITVSRLELDQPGVGAAPLVLDRIAELSGDREADEQRYREFLGRDPLAPPGSIPDEVAAHLARDFGPSQLALGGDWLLNIPLHRSLSLASEAIDPAPLRGADGPPHQRLDLV